MKSTILLSLFAAGISVHAGTLYVSNFGNNVVESFDSTGSGSVFASIPGGAGSAGLARDSAGNLFVAEAITNNIFEVTPSGAISTFASTGLSNPLGLAFDGAGNLYAANANDGTIEEFTPAGSGSVFANTGQTGLFGPVGLAFDAAGNLYVGLGFGIEEFTPGGVGSTFVGDVSGIAFVHGLTFGSDGNLYAVVSDNTIEKITPGGAVSLFASGLSNPEFDAFDDLGNLYVTNNDNNTVDKITPAGSVSLFANSGLNAPEGIVFASAATPEPSTMALFGAGFAFLLFAGRRMARRGI